MLAKSLAISSHLLSKSVASPAFPALAHSAFRFSTWKPKVPKHEIRFNKSTYRLPHPIWDVKAAEEVEQSHYKPKGIRDWIALSLIRTIRNTFDFFSGYRPGKCNESTYLARFIFLETIAGIPGMIGAMIRHTRSVGRFRADGGWIHHLIEEAENERMHLFTFLDLRQPGFLLKSFILGSQAIFVMGYTAFYFITPKTAHRFVGYLEEEAIKTYTTCINELNEGTLKEWNTLKAPKGAIDYWELQPGATMKDLLLVVRADEMMHREVNHRLGDLSSTEAMTHMEYVVKESMKEANEKSGPEVKV